MKLVVISGMSGSGKSVALHTLEDLGYYCVDNLPVGLLPAFADKLCNAAQFPQGQAAVSIDARNLPDDLVRFPEILDGIKHLDLNCEILYLDCADETLLKRYSETRRRHPLSRDDLPLRDAIGRERDLLGPIAMRANLHIDTSHLNLYQLRDLIRERVADRQAGTLSLLFQSFGYKHGIPADADFVFDLRCLPNPYWVPNLRPLTGLDPAVGEFLEQQPTVVEMREQIERFLEIWIPRFEADSRSYVTVALGCTGGHHRSVYLAKRLADHFRQQRSNVQIRHRELS